jgi:hypothetical protein
MQNANTKKFGMIYCLHLEFCILNYADGVFFNSLLRPTP